MNARILLTTTSYQDTPGPHHGLLEGQGFEIVRERGPLDEETMMRLAGEFDGLLCGDDALTRRVLEASMPRLQVISKYGIGLDKIDLGAADELGIPVLFTPGVNHTTVAEHAFCLILAHMRNLVDVVNATRSGRWLRPTGHELWQKRIGILGMGRIGFEVARRAKGFEMEVSSFSLDWPDAADELGVTRYDTPEELFRTADVISVCLSLNEQTRGYVNRERLALLRPGTLLVNTSRGELVDNDAVVEALEDGRLSGYVTDVLDVEPPPSDHPLLVHPRTIVTSHIGSRTYESVPRQAMMATENLIHYLLKSGPYRQANNPAPRAS